MAEGLSKYETMDVDVKKEVCRTCLQPNENLVSIFSSIKVSNLDFTPILELLKIFTDITITPNDGFPDKICIECIDQIHETHTFKIKSDESEAILKKLKEDGKTVIEITHVPKELIKTEKTDDYKTSTDEQLKQVSTPVVFEVTKQEEPVLAEVKIEHEIETLEEIANDTDSDDEPLASERKASDIKSRIAKSRKLKVTKPRNTKARNSKAQTTKPRATKGRTNKTQEE